MSLTTRCPACRTMFRVVPDQLRISEGWVRCGKCEEIFNASENLRDADVPPPLTEDDAAMAGPETVPFDRNLLMAEPAPPPPRPKSKRKPAKVDAPTVRENVDFVLEDPQHAPAGLAEVVPSGKMPLSEGVEGGVPVEATSAKASVIIDDPATVPDMSGGVAQEELSFMRKARSASRWHRPLVRALLFVFGHALVLTLAVQVLVQERDRLVVMVPELRPLAEEACYWFNCTLGPLRQIESVVIESSTFRKGKGDIYSLGVTLRNNALVDVAMPTVELSLTDTLDQPLLRRAISPQDIGAHTGVIPASGEFQATLMLSIKTNGADERLAGYSLHLFYP